VAREMEYCLLGRSAGTIMACERAINAGIMLIREALTCIFGDLDNVRLSDKRLVKKYNNKARINFKA
jgi:hypothetical protein